MKRAPWPRSPRAHVSSDEGYSAGSLLGRLMQSCCLPERLLRWVCNPAELPVRLQQIACLIGRDGAWRAYTDEAQWWFAVANATGPASGVWTLKVSFFSHDGALCGVGSWRFCPNTGFVLTEIFADQSSCDWTPILLDCRTH